MRKHPLIAVLILFMLPLASIGTPPEAEDGGAFVQFQFYSTYLTLPAVPDLRIKKPEKIDETYLKKVWGDLDFSDHEPLVERIESYRENMRLSGWHFYDIIARYSESVFRDEPMNNQTLLQWFLLRKCGIDARIFYTNEDLYVHVPSNEIEFGFYTILKGDKKFINLTAHRHHLKLDHVTAYMPDFQPGDATDNLNMRVDHLPELPDKQTVRRMIQFKHAGELFHLNCLLNQDHLMMMEDYPYYNQWHYFEVALSNDADATLVPQIERLIDGKTLEEKVMFLLSFTRTSFFYKDDRNRYGKEKPMTAEQTLYHSYSDCEDRSALFYYLTRRILNLPIIVIDFQTHVGCAVEIEGAKGMYFEYKGRRFVYCEPTGPEDKLGIGEMWDEVRKQKAQILTEYIPG